MLILRRAVRAKRFEYSKSGYSAMRETDVIAVTIEMLQVVSLVHFRTLNVSEELK